MKLIDKDDIAAEIERQLHYVNSRIESYEHVDSARSNAYFRMLGNRNVLESIKDFLSTIETKEVDLDESARHYLLHEHISPLNEVLHRADLKVEMQYHKDIEDAYKAGFELGLKAKEGKE